MKLSDLNINQKGIVATIHSEQLATSLLEIGLMEGDEVELILVSPFGDPLLVQFYC